MKFIIPLGLSITPVILIIAALHIAKYLRRLRSRRSPLTKNLLRGPGHSLRKNLDDLHDQLNERFMWLLFFPMYFYAAALSMAVFSERALPGYTYAVFAIGGTAMTAIALIRLLSLQRRLRSTRLGYDGELAVGEELNRLASEGWYVFHDVPAGKFNVDHVVVGAKGVFAVEVKTKSKRNSGNPKEQATVTYDGRRLEFANGWNTAFLDQSERQAAWLSKWLTSATGDLTAVTPVLAIPGWWVNRVGKGRVRVVNPAEIRKVVAYGTPLDSGKITRIVHQLDQRCRDVEPISNKDFAK